MVLIWCFFLLPRVNASDLLQIVLYFCSIKSYFWLWRRMLCYLTESTTWGDLQWWKTGIHLQLFVLQKSDQILNIFGAVAVLWLLSEEAGFAPWGQGEAVSECLGNSFKCIASTSAHPLIHLHLRLMERLTSVLEWKPRSACLKSKKKKENHYVNTLKQNKSIQPRKYYFFFFFSIFGICNVADKHLVFNFPYYFLFWINSMVSLEMMYVSLLFRTLFFYGIHGIFEHFFPN